MNNHKVLATFVVAILAASAFSVVGMTSFPLQKATAQGVTITTSADSHGNAFFGEGAVQVVVNDPDADDDDLQETVTVDIDADPDDGTATSSSFTVAETSESSGRFEFFLVHVDSALLDTDFDAINTNGADEHPVSGSPAAGTAQASVIRFGPAGDLALATSDLFEDVSFDITVGDEEITTNYEETGSELNLDRSTYGSDSFVYTLIIDQDANLNPTEPDSFDATDVELNTILFDIEGATFNDTVTFEETGDNTATFEGILELTDTASATDDELVFTSEAVEVTLNDVADYVPPTDVTASTDTSSRSFDIDDEDGEIDTVESLTFSSELKLNLNDNDRNRDSDDDESLDDAVSVSVDAADAAGDVEFLDMTETDDNTGIFIIDLSNDELRVTFLEDGETPTANNSLLELRPDDITEDLVVEYTDASDDDSLTSVTSSQTMEMTLATGSIDLPEAAGINDDFILTLTDADLNDNPRTKDSYVFTFEDVASTPPYNLTRGGDTIGELANLEIEIEGEEVSFATDLAYTLVETDISSGVFTTELSMSDILDSTGVEADDGDNLEITYNDFMDDTSRESSDELAIGEASAGLDFSRTTMPIPPDPASAVAGEIGEEVFTTLIVTDPDVNELSGAEDTIDFVLGTDPNEFTVEIDGDGFSATIDDATEIDDDFEGSTSLEDILPSISTITLAETGSSTGVFDDELVFVNGGLDTDSWHDLEITITYTDVDGDEESGGITFRGNDGSVVVDQNSAKSGTVLVITVEDQDLNLDDDTVEEFSAVEGTPAGFLLGVETEDEEVPGVTSETFRETGADTGVFSASYTVGTDIPVAQPTDDEDEIEQASNILITYNDEVDSTGGGGDEIEIDVPVVTSTGAITVTPELVGPGTEVTVIITDTDLDEDSRSTDDYDTPDPDSDDFFVSFRSDRTEVGRASPDIEETGPNTGVFTFMIELITDESACEDDDLGEAKFEATGGSEPEMGACPGDLVSINYDDEQDGSGRSTSVSAIIEVKSWDPEFSSDKPSYAPGDRVTVTISDPDANRKPDVADSLSDIRVFSDSDRVGEELSALETGRDTGVFRLSFGSASSTTGGAITVRTGDEVTVEYTDEFPADFEEAEDDKDFTFVVPFGATGGSPTSTTPSAPVAKDVQGGTVSQITVGQQVVLTTQITNNIDDELPFVGLIEVRDSDGITQFLAWQTGVMDSGDRSEIGLSWTPEDAGDYQVRTFVISSLNNPQVLSPVATSTISVS
jgi:hypothetical protein